MTAAHVRRGASSRARSRKGSSRVSVPKKLAAKLPVKESQANRLAGWAFALFALAVTGAALVALDVPAKVGIAAGEAVGDAGFGDIGVDGGGADADQDAEMMHVDAFARADIERGESAQLLAQQMHMDVMVADLDAGEQAVTELGATKAEHQPGTTFRVFLDPAGHPFCLCVS